MEVKGSLKKLPTDTKVRTSQDRSTERDRLTAIRLTSFLEKTRKLELFQRQVSKLVFYAQLTGTVISGRCFEGNVKETSEEMEKSTRGLFRGHYITY